MHRLSLNYLNVIRDFTSRYDKFVLRVASVKTLVDGNPKLRNLAEQQTRIDQPAFREMAAKTAHSLHQELALGPLRVHNYNRISFCSSYVTVAGDVDLQRPSCHHAVYLLTAGGNACKG